MYVITAQCGATYTTVPLKWFSVALIRFPLSKVRLEAVYVLRSSSHLLFSAVAAMPGKLEFSSCSRNMFSGRFTIFGPSATHHSKIDGNTSKRNINFVSFSLSPVPTQVHTRITYLRHLIVSLAQAKDISKTLLIFSHDYYDEDINDLVQTIDFCKVLQVTRLFAALARRSIANWLHIEIVCHLIYADILSVFNTNARTWISWRRSRRLPPQH